MNAITVVGLGPGPREFLTLGAVEALKKAEKIILRTEERCDAAKYLREIGLTYETLDFLHESCEDFEELNARAAEYVLAKAEESSVCYAVFDPAADETVAALSQKAPVQALAGVPLSAPLMNAAPRQEKIEIQTASGLNVTSIQNPLLILECGSRILTGECKLQLLSWYAPDQQALFFPPCDGPIRAYRPVALEDIDRQERYDHTCAVLLPALPLTDRSRFDFYDLVRVMDILRGENGCPWDREQTHESLSKYLIEEAYETSAAINEGDWDHVAEELGDVLLQVAFQANIGRQYGTMELSDITTSIVRKMIHRHRHIFGTDQCGTAEDVRNNWERLKKEERGYRTQADVMRGVPKGLPPMLRAEKVQKKARDVGFDWQGPDEALKKVIEEAGETDRAVRLGGPDVKEEIGDLLFSCAAAARLAGVDAESALQGAVEKFIFRFSALENAILQAGKRFQDLTLSEMVVYWEGIKARADKGAAQ